MLTKDLDNSIIRGLCQPRPTSDAIGGLNRLELRYNMPMQSLFSGDEPPQPEALGQRTKQEQRGGDPDKLRGFEAK